MPPRKKLGEQNGPQKASTILFYSLNDWKESLEAKLKESLPHLNDAAKEVFGSACHAVQSANASLQDAKALLEQLQTQKPVDPQAVEKAKNAVADADQAFQDALDTCQNVAVDAVLDRDLTTLFTEDFEDGDLVSYTVLDGKCKAMAQWMDENPDHADKLMKALHDPELMRLFLQSGGPRSGAYGNAVKLYYELGVDGCQDPVLKRLALAVALELADPYPLFNQQGHTDAKQRYVHYEQAYLLGELDPIFPQLNVWEMRQVVNSDATEDELSWGRQSLLNYRPDIALQNDPVWQYCQIVRTDVGYCTPDWYKTVKSYDQILSGGGKCGPRAWYGRFICKAFGIPTWGVRQPGHAAMTRWTRDGWCVCLGGGMWKSWWNDQGAPDFLLEVNARSACTSERVFQQNVLRLQWISSYCKENPSAVRMKGIPDPESLWCSLGMMQRRRIGAAGFTIENHFQRQRENKNQLVQWWSRQDSVTFETVTEKGNCILIPASSCSKPTRKDAKKVLFLPCFSGGQQLFLKEDADVEYTLSPSNFDTTTRTYKLTLRVCTAHRSEEPIIITIMLNNQSDPDAVHVLNMPYTVGMWQETDPISIEIGANSKINLSRPKQPYGFSLKEICLVP